MLVDEYCGDIAWDLRRYCGTRLDELLTGRLSYMELDWMLERLPPESAFKTSMRNQYTDEQLAAAADSVSGHGPWSRSEMLLAAVFDALQMLTHVQVSRGGVSSDPPSPLSRPGVVNSAKKQPMSPQQVAYMQRIRDLHAQQKGTEAAS